MRGHEIRHDILLFSKVAVELHVFCHKAVIQRGGGLAHQPQHPVGHMLRRDLELPGNMVLDERAQERVALVVHHIVIADAGTHEHALHARHAGKLLQQRDIVPMIDHQVFAVLEAQALPVRADAAFELLLAGRLAEIRRGPAYVVDVSLEIRLLRQDGRFPQERSVAARGNNAPLMERERAERACAEAPAAGGERKLDLKQRRDLFLIGGMRRARVGQLVYRVQLFGRKRRGRRVHDKESVPMRLHKAFPADRILLAVLRHERGSIRLFVPRHGFVAFDRFVFIHLRERIRHVAGAVHVGDLLHGEAARKRICDLDDLPFPHAVNEKICARIRKDAAAHLIIPVIVMRKTPEARLDAADDDRHAAVCLPHTVRINDRCAVRALPRFAAGRVSVARAALFRGGVMVHHGIDVSRADEERKARPAKAAELLRAVPVRLGDDAHRIAVALQHAADDRRAETRMIHVCVADDVYEIKLPDAARGKLLSRGGQEF